MWQVLIFGLVIVFVVFIDSIFEINPKVKKSSRKVYFDQREQMNFPSSYLIESLVTPDNSPCSSHSITRPSTPIKISRSNSRRSLFSHEYYESSLKNMEN